MITGLLRVRNEARWIERVIQSILPCCERIIVMDDHSTDQTAFIAASQPRTEVFESPYTGLNEVRDKNLLLSMARDGRSSSSWLLMIDGDEVLAPGGAAAVEKAVRESGAMAYKFHILYLWDREDQIRTDGIYEDFWRVRLFRDTGRNFTPSGPKGFHCGNSPNGNAGLRIDAPILHFGYLHPEDRLRKWRWYNQQDPGNRLEDEYRHIVAGLVPEVPAEMKTKHAGPLKLEPL